jgi:Lon protease-like protein
VLFPGGRLPLRIFEQRYMTMAKACLREGSAFGVCLILEGREVATPAGEAPVPAQIGCLARIAEWDMQQLGVLQIVAQGERRFRILERRTQADGLALATVELLPEEPGADEASARLNALLSALPLPLELKQELLELPDARARLERLNTFLGPAAPA